MQIDTPPVNTVVYPAFPGFPGFISGKVCTTMHLNFFVFIFCSGKGHDELTSHISLGLAPIINGGTFGGVLTGKINKRFMWKDA